MNTSKISVIARRSRFEPSVGSALVANPASPLVLQGLLQILANLEQKVDALTIRSQQGVTVAPVRPQAVPERVLMSEDTTTALAKSSEAQTSLSATMSERLLRFFD
jgi:hypothetical protein